MLRNFLRQFALPTAGVALAVALTAFALMTVAFVQANGAPIDPTRVTYNDLIEADGDVNTAIYVVTPGTLMFLQCVRLNAAAEYSSAPGGGLSYCKWRRATDADLQVENKKQENKPTPSKDKRLQS